MRMWLFASLFISVSAAAAPSSLVDPDETLCAASRRGAGTTGLYSAAVAGYGNVASKVGLPIPESVRQVIQGRQQLRLAKFSLVPALAVNPAKISEAEWQWIEENNYIGPSLFDSPAAQQARMKGIRGGLSIALQQALRDANDPNLAVSIRTDAQKSASALRNFLEILGNCEE